MLFRIELTTDSGRTIGLSKRTEYNPIDNGNNIQLIKYSSTDLTHNFNGRQLNLKHKNLDYSKLKYIQVIFASEFESNIQLNDFEVENFSIDNISIARLRLVYKNNNHTESVDLLPNDMEPSIKNTSVYKSKGIEISRSEHPNTIQHISDILSSKNKEDLLYLLCFFNVKIYGITYHTKVVIKLINENSIF